MSVAYVADSHRYRLASTRPVAERLVAYGMSGFLALHLVVADFQVPTLLAVLLLPVSLPAVRRFRGGLPLILLAAAAAVSSIVLTYANDGDHRIGVHEMLAKSMLIVGIGICVVTLLWARSIVGLRGVALAYGTGSFASLALTGVDTANIWKFSLSVPIVLIVLSTPVVARARWAQVAVLVVLAAASGLLDSRSLAGQLLVAAALLLTRRSRRSRARGWIVAVQIALIGVAGFFLIQQALLAGLLGATSQARTQLQIQTGGSIITGGRPEIGASVALILAHPAGYGGGTNPSYHDIQVAKEGLSRVGYDSSNGYVNNYLFGPGFEVHSVAGDLWLLGGIAGLVFAVLILVCVVGGMAHGIARGTVLAISLFLGVRTVWDLAFSPILSTYFTIGLALALLLPLASPARGPARHPRSGGTRVDRPLSLPGS